MRFRLRTLFIGVLIIAGLLGWLASRIDDARREQRAIADLAKIGVRVTFNSSLSSSSDARFDLSARQSEATKTIDEWVGLPLFGCVIAVHGEHLSDDRKREQTDSLAPIARFSQVQLVNFDHASISDGDLAHLGRLHRLRVLYLWGTKVGDSGVENIKHLTELRRLGLQGTLITDAGVEHLSSLKNLESLNLSGTRVTDECVPTLSVLKKLNYLNLDNTRISDRGLALLASKLPHAEIRAWRNPPMR